MANIRQVSKEAHVSVATVSRVINGAGNVSEATKAKVEAAMASLGYKPNAFAQSLATNKSDTVGILVSDLAGPFFGEMMKSIELTARESGKHIIVTNALDSQANELDAINFLLKRRCDALILHLDTTSDEQIVDLIATHKTPIIIVNRFVPDIPDHCVYLNNELGGYQAAKHLIDLGHRDFACITGPLFKSDARGRLMGYMRALKEADIEYNENQVVESNFLEDGGITGIERLLQRKVTFTGLICQNDLMAFGAMNALKAKGYDIPKDISIVGYDDVLTSSYVEPALTTIRVPIAEMGRQAAQLAVNLSNQQNKKISHIFQPELIIRDSATQPRWAIDANPDSP